LVDQYQFTVKVVERVNDANSAVVRIRDMKTQIEKVAKDPKSTPAIASAATALTQKLTAVEGVIYEYRSKAGEDPLNYGVKLNDRLAGVTSVLQSGQMPPSRQAKEVFAGLTKLLQVQLDALKSLESTDLKAFNALLQAQSLAPIVPKTPALGANQRRRGGEDEDDNDARGFEAGD
jgi:hypothetical protein